MNETNVAGPYVLYVEDSESDRFIVKKLWREFTAARSICVNDAKQALAFIEECARGEHEWPHLMLLDLNMPGMSGFELLSKIRKDPRCSVLPVIVISTSELDSDVRACLREGANGYLVKSSDANEFSNMLRATYAFWFEHVAHPAAA